MFHQSTLPSQQEAIDAISQEESRLKVMRESPLVSSHPVTARNIAICTGLQPPINTGQPTGIAWPVLNDMSFSTGQVARY